MKKDFGVAARLMARKAVVLKDTNDLFVEANSGSNRFVRAGSVSSEEDENRGEQQKPGAGAEYRSRNS